MIRGPSVPRLKGLFLPALLVLALSRAAILASFAPGVDLEPHVRPLIFVGVLLSFAIGILAWPALAPFSERLRQPRLRNWLVFWGAFILTAWLSSTLLKHWIQALLGPGFVMSKLWSIPMFTILTCLAFGEMIQAHVDRVAEARRMIDRVMEAHGMVRWAREAEGRRLRQFLVSRVERELRELRREVTSLLDPAVEGSERLPALRDRIESLRETDLREASHLLHPHVPKVGLAPALDFLARRVGGRLPVTIDLPDDASDAVSALKAPLRHAAYCLAEAALERATDACEAQAATVRISVPSDDQLLLVIEHDCHGCSDDVADSRFALAAARLELAGGSMSEDGSRQRERITMSLPVNAMVDRLL